ncbi:hypothetical protein CEXT_161271 [Caerostris extrusa]|uniref:Uncharacterized protein n=1 Tax=Caerostris extrusa TaxID=172846 RepID=A0AAV4V6Y9_CAEEX|nr:hypothetical protein CEXT_161271 [Caerostris extrusa]
MANSKNEIGWQCLTVKWEPRATCFRNERVAIVENGSVVEGMEQKLFRAVELTLPRPGLKECSTGKNTLFPIAVVDSNSSQRGQAEIFHHYGEGHLSQELGKVDSVARLKGFCLPVHLWPWLALSIVYVSWSFTAEKRFWKLRSGFDLMLWIVFQIAIITKFHTNSLAMRKFCHRY